MKRGQMMTMQHDNMNGNGNKIRIFGTIAAVMGAVYCGNAQSAGVTSRTPRPTSGANAVLMASTSAAQNTKTTATSSTTTTSTTQPDTTATNTTKVSNIPTNIQNKSSYFSSFLGLSASSDTSGTSLADKVRAQRELMAAKSASDEIVGRTATVSAGANTCDSALRSCMTEKCGSNFSKCASDDATIWGTKIDSCRRSTSCTGHEYALLSLEILSDRDHHERLSAYNTVINCGERYNTCIIDECGANFSKCLGKTAGDHAISNCSKIAKECQTADNGLAARVMGVFGNLRQDAERAVQADEKRLYELRTTMRGACERLGAMFDERSLDCVYTVNFYAGNDSKLYASKKAYAGATFTCDPNWFGVDVTTFMENAFRLTREQASASAAMLGSGLGIGVGAITSGAIDRAVTTHKAEKELKDAQIKHNELYGTGDKSDIRKCENSGGEWNSEFNRCDCKDDRQVNENGRCRSKDSAEQAKTNEDKKTDKHKANCTKDGGEWDAANNTCDCPDGKKPKDNGGCKKDNDNNKGDSAAQDKAKTDTTANAQNAKKDATKLLSGLLDEDGKFSADKLTDNLERMKEGSN